MITIILLALVLQFEVGTLAVGHFPVLLQCNLRIQSVVVRTIVGNVQLTITTHHRQVATAVQSACMLCTHGDEVVMIDVVERSRGITEHRYSVVVALTV